MLTWSPDGQLLATVNENMPHAIWIWDLGSAELAAVLCQVGPVRALAWSPAGRSLAAVAGGGRLYLWSPAGASVVHVPLGGFQVRLCGVGARRAAEVWLKRRQAARGHVCAHGRLRRGRRACMRACMRALLGGSGLAAPRDATERQPHLSRFTPLVPLAPHQATGVSWAQGGEALALHGRESFCCGYVGT
jgi:hypothetical protein